MNHRILRSVRQIMIDLKEYWPLKGKRVKVICIDGQIYIGRWTEWFDEEDNEWRKSEGLPADESILVELSDGVPMEFYAHEIASIEKAEP